MEDLIFTPIVLGIGFAVHAVVRRFHDEAEGRYLTYGFLMHMASSIAIVLIYKYYYLEGGDIITYQLFAMPVVDGLHYDFAGIFPETVKVFLHQEHKLPFDLWGEGSTGSMSMVSVWVLALLGGSLYAASMIIAIASYASKVLIYRALRAEFPASEHRKVLIALFLIPSAVLWTSTLLKEPVTLVFFGPMMLGARWIVDGRRLGYAVALLLFGGAGIALLKPYILLAFGTSAAVWMVWERVVQRKMNVVAKPAYLILGAISVMVAFAITDKFIPAVAERGLGQSVATQRRTAATIEAGSNFSLESDEDPQAETTLGSQLMLAPLALVTALFRPVLFEARNAMQAANAIEMAWLLVATWQVFRRNTMQQLVKRITTSSTLMFCLAFVVTMGVGTGLSTPNLGTLSRYRAPMVPFFVLALLVLRDPARRHEPEAVPVPAAV